MCQCTALFGKNWRIWRKNCWGAVWEVATFFVFIAIFMLLYKFAKDAESTSKMTLNEFGFDLSRAPTLASADPLDYYKFLAGPPDPTKPMSRNNFPPVVLKECFDEKEGGVIALAPDFAITQLLKGFLESQFLTVRMFADREAIQTFVTSDEYGSTGPDGKLVQLCYGVSFQEKENKKWKYSFHYNFTKRRGLSDLPKFDEKLIDPFKQENDFVYDQMIQSGVPLLQNIIDSAILRTETGANSAQILTSIHKAPHKEYAVSEVFAYTNEGQISTYIIFPILVIYLRFISAIMREKEQKIRGNLKNMGMSMAAYYTSWILFYFMIHLIFSIVWALILKATLMQYSQGFYIFLLYFLYGINFLCFGFFLTAFFDKSKSAIVAGTILFFLFMLVSIAQDSIQSTDSLNAFLNISPTASLSNGAVIVMLLESLHTGMQIELTNFEYNRYTFNSYIVTQIIEALIFLVLGLYLDQVFPTEMGIRKHPLFFLGFPFKKQNQIIEDKPNENMDLIEDVSDDLKAQISQNKALQIEDLRKIYANKKVAVEKLNLNMYTDQIFALLGHNGAGKTTTISMISGLFKQTSGRINIMGYDTVIDQNKIKTLIGVCPQTNPLYNELTCREHLHLYAKIKGSGCTDKDVEDVLRDIDLLNKIDYPAGKLSGGQKRKLCVALAFIGGSQVVLLDEPTSGMDTFARRHLWEMVKNYKKDKIIILTTHFMDEADFLGDRIGIMGDGRLITCGSSLFLKKKFGVGYILTVVKTGTDVNADKITEIVMKNVQTAKKTADISMEIKYQLPSSESNSFEKLFKELEDNKDSLGIQTFGINLTSLEDVFLNVAIKDKEAIPESKEEENSCLKNSISIKSGYNDDNFKLEDIRIKGAMKIFTKHFIALTKKRFIYFRRDIKGIICEIFIPIVVITCGL